jgi:hypothetical protein
VCERRSAFHPALAIFARSDTWPSDLMKSFFSVVWLNMKYSAGKVIDNFVTHNFAASRFAQTPSHLTVPSASVLKRSNGGIIAGIPATLGLPCIGWPRLYNDEVQALEARAMQFGRTYGIALMVLGLIMCVFQAIQYMAPPKKEAAAAQTETQTRAKTEHVTSSLPGILGAASFVVGIALFITARRKDEPDPEHKVK